MDAVIRAVRLGDARTRLGSSLPTPAERPIKRSETGSLIQTAQPIAPDLSTERAALEQSLRRELAVEAEKLFTAERQKGFANGQEEGRRQAAEDHQTKMNAARERMHQHFATLQDRIDQTVGTATQELLDRATDLAFASVCKIAGAHATSRQFVAAIVDEQLRRHMSTGPLTIRLHPDDLALLRDGNETSGPNLVHWTADDAIALGGCLVDTPMGRYDARLETQLTKLKHIFEQARAGDEHG